MVRRVVLVVGVTFVLFVPAALAQYPPPEETVTVSDTTVVPGQPITISAAGFEPGTSVSFELNPPLGSVTADANTVATITVTIPTDTTPGAHTICASGIAADNGQPLTVCTNITVLGAAAPTAAAPLPVTGSNSSIPASRIGAALVAAGGLALLVARKRRLASA